MCYSVSKSGTIPVQGRLPIPVPATSTPSLTAAGGASVEPLQPHAPERRRPPGLATAGAPASRTGRRHSGTAAHRPGGTGTVAASGAAAPAPALAADDSAMEYKEAVVVRPPRSIVPSEAVPVLRLVHGVFPPVLNLFSRTRCSPALFSDGMVREVHGTR